MQHHEYAARVEDLLRLMTDVVSVRRWDPEPVTADERERLFAALGMAPSSTQPWEILQLDTESARKAVISATLDPLMTPGTEGGQGWLLRTPLVLMVCIELRRAKARTGEQGHRAALQEVGAAVQNLRLMAGSLGLKTAVVREFHLEPMAAALGLPWFLEPVAIVGVGHSSAHLEYPPKLPLDRILRPGYEPPPSGAAPAGELPRPLVPHAEPVEAIYRRRSVRRFTGEPLAEGVREQLLDAATRAPTGGNMQPWEFILLEDPAVREAAVATTFAGYFAGPDNQQKWLLDAPMLLAVCVNRWRTEGRYGEGVARQAILDVAAAIQNLLLTATQLGLGGCWVGGFREEILSQVLQLPAGVELVGMVAIGHAAELPGHRHRMDLSLVAHRDRWGRPYYQSSPTTSTR